jgi:iron complex transport system permease protein
MATATLTGAPTARDTLTASALRANRRRRVLRSVTVTCALAGAVGTLFVVTMMVGSFRLSAGEVLGSVL